ncbi:MAG: prealbumin-like fold domain-containing protein [Bilifractor sp.]
MRKARWRKMITVFCVIALVAGMLTSPLRIYAGDSATASSSTAAGTAQASSESTSGTGSDLVGTGTSSGTGSENSGSTASEEGQAEQSRASAADSEASTSATGSGSGEAGTTESESQNTENSATISTASESSENSSSASHSVGAKSALSVNALSDSGSTTSSSSSSSADGITGNAEDGLNLASSYRDASGTTKYFLSDYRLSYLSDNDWVTVDHNDTETKISAYTRLKLDVYFGGISARDLQTKYGNKLYIDIPADSVLTNPTVTSGIVQDANGDNAGTIAVSGNRITLTVDSDYLSQKLDKEGTDFIIQNGSLTFYATPDPEKVRKESTQHVKMGHLDVVINFDPDSDAQSASLTLAKSSPTYSTDDAGKAYLNYTLTITAGDARMPEVMVKDHFTFNAKFVDSYVGVSTTPVKMKTSGDTTTQPYETIDKGSSATHGTVALSADKSDSDPGTMLWSIGNMAANEVRTLHYSVKLKADYVGIAGAWNGVITNTATPYAKKYEHNTVTSSFTPQSAATVNKEAGEIGENKDGTITIPYTITVTTDKDNTWTLKNLKISDYLGAENTKNVDKTTLWNAITPTKDMPDLGFTDFTLSDGKTTVSVPPKGTSSSDTPYYMLKGSNEYPGFNLYIGDIAPGATRTITVKLTMKPIFSSAAVTLGNRATVFTDETSSLGNRGLASGNTVTNFDKQYWDRKVVGTATEKDIQQTVSSNVYSYNGTSWSKDTASPTKIIPVGSYKYRVVVNEQGKWDVSTSSFADELSNGTYLKYAGYLKLDYYKTGVNSSVSSGSDTSVADALEGKTPYKTVYLDIDGKTTFNFSPYSLSTEFGKGAYLLTYYAAPISGNFSKIVVGNSFTLSGYIIGPRNTTYVLPSMNVKTNVTVTGTTNYTAHKYGWYYASADTSDGFTNGKLYWVITVDGTKVPSGVQLRDVPGTAANRTKDTSIAGVYFGDMVSDWSTFTDKYVNFASMTEDSSFESLGASNYSWESEKSGPGTLTFNKDVTIPDRKTMYIVLLTEPSNKPSTDARTQTTFNNALQERSNSTMKYNKVNTATIYTLGQGTNFKEFGEYGTYDAATGNWSDREVAKYHNINRILKTYSNSNGAQTLSSGTYVDYILVVNYAGDESGTFKVEDVVPDGMEPVYVRYFWIPEGIRSNENAPTMPALDSKALGSGDWTDIGLKDTAIDNINYKNSAYAYYDASSRRIVFQAGNLKKGTIGQIDKKDLQVQIVMRVTDSSTIMGQSKTYTNTMKVYTTDDTLVSTSSVDTTVKTHTIDKSAGDVSNGDVPFTLTVNPLGLDLMKNADTLTLVDELTGSMTVDPASVKVKDSNGKDIDSDLWKLSLTKDTSSKKTVMTLIVPDAQKLTITYNTSIDASPGTPVKYTNTAHWYGIEEDKKSTVENTVSYSVDASIGFSNNPVISLVKADQNNVTKKLSGAKFAIYQVENIKTSTDSSGKKTVTWTKTTEDPIETLTTGSDGKLTFGNGTTKLQYNTIYAIVETGAPSGYVKDDTPIFVAMARADKSGNYPNESTDWGSTVDKETLKTYTADDLAKWADQGVTVNYKGSTYTYTAYNQKASLQIEKSFLDKGGTALATPPDGTFSFGLYNVDNNLIETLIITYSGGKASYQLTENGKTETVDSAMFRDLNVGDIYYVYELDGQGDPMKDGRILYNKEGNGYIVKYQVDTNGNQPKNPNQVIAPDSKTAAAFTVSNQEYPIPSTGISPAHNAVYIGTAILLGVLLAGAFWMRRRKRNRGPRA